MKRHTHRHEDFSPLQDKTLFSVLRQLFVTEFGYGTKVIFAEAMIERILDTVEHFVRPASLLKPGQLLWTAVANDGRKHAFQAMKNIPQVPVVLDLITDDDLQRMVTGDSYTAVRAQRHARLLEQAYAQQGVLAQSDLSAITLSNLNQVRTDLARFRSENNRHLPFRGSIQDIGGTITHKVEVIRLFEAGYLEPDICRQLSIPHDLSAVENYVQTYKNVLKLLDRDFTPQEISGILGISCRLVDAYIDIASEHHPNIMDSNGNRCQQQTAPSPCPA
jgi:hypothetical protein